MLITVCKQNWEKTMINRQISSSIRSKLHLGKAIIILGARQSGKTTLLQDLGKEENNKLYLNCDDADDRNALEIQTIAGVNNLVGKSKLLLIDEAQRVLDIGITLKLIVDSIPGVQVIATGSSSFELSNRINEPLTGRKYEYAMHPFSYLELAEHHGAYQEKRFFANRLIYGSYPDIVNNPGDQQSLLNLLVGSYLYKDVFVFQDLRKPELLDKLLRALALQIGSEVSYTELAQLVGTDHSTVQRYIQLLEHAFILFRLPNYSSNQRNEIKRSRKIYFWDNGVRNCLIEDFRKPDKRDDIGKLWENYIVSERMKMLDNIGLFRKSYFWRNVNNSEIDYLEYYDNKLEAYEIKWNPKRSIRTEAFKRNYPTASVQRIDPENYVSFLTAANPA